MTRLRICFPTTAPASDARTAPLPSAHRAAPPIAWLSALTIVCVAAGIFLRVYQLDSQTFWLDECWTAAHVTGHRVGDVAKRLTRPGAPDVSAAEMQRMYQQFDGNSGLLRTMRVMVETDPQHPPVYYAISYAWARCFGDSVGSLRAPAALFAVTSVGFVFLLARRLFRRDDPNGTAPPVAALVATTLFAVSPFHVLYAHEAREYSLWTLMVAISSIALLRALEAPALNWRRWSVYALTVALGLYTFTLFAFAVAAHAVFVVAVTLLEGRRSRATLLRYVVASACGVAAFAPWAALIVLRRRVIGDTTAWMNEPIPASHMLGRWAFGVTRVFVDTGSSNEPHGWLLAFISIAAVAGVVAACLLSRDRRARWYLAAITLAPFAAVALPDLIFGGRRSAIPRYMTPAFLGVGLSVAYVIARGMFASRATVRVASHAALALIVGVGAASATSTVGARSWWNKSSGPDVVGSAHALSTADARVLIVAEENGKRDAEFLSLSRYLPGEVRLRMFTSGATPPAPSTDITDFYVFDPTPDVREQFAKSTGLALVPVPATHNTLWRVPRTAAADVTRDRPPTTNASTAAPAR